MKKIFALLLALSMTLMLAVPCFAAKVVKFSVRTVSETDSEVVISVDYEGGTPFYCFDFELTYNEKKLKVLEAYDGDGLEAFVRDAKKNGAVSASTINRDTNPIKDSMAITVAFKVVDGKDLFIAKFKKLSTGKITSDDIKVVFTNCATDTEKIQATVINMIGGGSVSNSVTSAASKVTANNKTEKATTTTKENSSTKNSTSVADNKQDTTTGLTEIISEIAPETSIDSENGAVDTYSYSSDDASEKTDNTKKIIIISTLAICLLFVIVAVCVFLSKKSKKDKTQE